MSNFIKSPLNYTGNKYRILDQLQKHFPKKINVMVDLFCGGATVGLNTPAKKIIFIDSNKSVIDLLIYLSKQNFENLLNKLEKLINLYGLSYSYKNGYSIYRKQCKNISDATGLKDFNKPGFEKLRNDYNNLENKNTDLGNEMLYLLVVYGFNNDIRFNSAGEFNIPVGKTDLNKMNVEKIKAFVNKIKTIECEFLCLDIKDESIKNILQKADFVYMDPPYLITDAVYNMFWSNNEEYKLLDIVDWLMENNISFALSNVLSKKEKINEPLSYWCHKNKKIINISHINFHYRSASYNKKNRNAQEQEVVITNKNYENK